MNSLNATPVLRQNRKHERVFKNFFLWHQAYAAVAGVSDQKSWISLAKRVAVRIRGIAYLMRMRRKIQVILPPPNS